MTDAAQTESLATRRGVLAGVGLVSLAGAITACGGGTSSSDTSASAGAASAATSAGGAGTSAAASAGSAASGALTTTSKVPVGSGTVIADQQVVVTQPTAGSFKAFSAVCTHMGCIVNQVSNGTIDCPCHGSQYSISTGAVVTGPAPRPLPAKQIKVSGDSIFLA